jgi:hypothetical protein
MREKLKDWSDADVAMFAVAQALGIMGPFIDFATAARYAFNASSSVGHALYTCLVALVEIGVLEQRLTEDGNMQLRWNPNYRGTWERDDPTLV